MTINTAMSKEKRVKFQKCWLQKEMMDEQKYIAPKLKELPSIVQMKDSEAEKL